MHICITQDKHWRAISDDEARIVKRLVSGSMSPAAPALLMNLDEALASRGTTWITDIRMPQNVTPVSLPDGPLDAIAEVSDAGEYVGELLVWITGGRLSGLEYAWISDVAPTHWPASDAITVRSPRRRPTSGASPT